MWEYMGVSQKVWVYTPKWMIYNGLIFNIWFLFCFGFVLGVIEEVDGLVRFKVTSSAPPTQLAGMASRSGRTRCFDQSADGFTQGEGTPQLGLAPKDHGDHDPESFLMVSVDPRN